jgi:hypothetical protein
MDGLDWIALDWIGDIDGLIGWERESGRGNEGIAVMVTYDDAVSVAPPSFGTLFVV